MSLLAVLTGTFVLQAAESVPIKVLSFNIRCENPNDGQNNWDLRQDFAMSLMSAEDYDFIGLQEAVVQKKAEGKSQTAYVIEHLPDYGVVYRSREVNENAGECTPIFYRKDRWKLDSKENGTFWLSATPDVAGSNTWKGACLRVASWGRFTNKATGKSVYFINTHFDHISETARQNSAVLLADFIAKRSHADEPVVLTGDFNCGETSPGIQYLSGKTVGIDGKERTPPVRMTDTFRVVHPEEPEQGSYHGFKGTPSKQKIDYIFATPDLKVLKSELIKVHREGRYPSDHFPLHAELLW
jgi:endonuclease/exonuclease/phosphatase family metal-dependent hydrolase